MAKARGKALEDDIKNSVPKHWHHYRLKDAPPFMGDDQNRFTPQNMCDCVIGNTDKRTINWCEEKETHQASLSFNNFCSKKAPIEKKYKKLRDMVKYDDGDFSLSWIIIRFKGKREGCFIVKAETILEYMLNPPILRGNKPTASFPYDWIVENGLRAPERKLKVNYRYTLTEVI